MSPSEEEVFTTWTSELAGWNASVVFVCGELDASTVPRFVSDMREVIRTGRHVIMDAHLLSYIDSTGVSALVSASNALRSGGRRMCLVGCHGLVSKVIRITRVDCELGIFEDIDGALAAMGQG